MIGTQQGIVGEETGLSESPSRSTEAYWRSRVPDHWEIPSNFSLFQERIDRGGDESEMLTVTIDRGILRQSEFLEGSSKKDSSNEDKSKYKRVKVGDLAYNKMRMWQGAVGFSPYEGIVSPAYIVLEPRRQINPRYYHYLFRTPLYTHLSAQHSHGICDDQNSLRFEDFKRIFSPLPPRPEQDAIVAYLDGKLKGIDSYLRVKEREIALLEERKRALIHRAVTRGLDPNFELQPSEISGAEEMPSHWESISIRRVADFVTSGSRGWAQFSAESGPMFLRICNLTRDSLDLRFDDIERVNPPAGAEGERTRVRPGDILISITAYIGSVAVVPFDQEEAYVSQHIALVRLKTDSILPKWVGYSLLSEIGTTQSKLMMYGGTKVGLSLDDVKSYTFPIPPLSEQRAIIESIERDTTSITSTITRARRQIERMQEYRTALIAEAVTGRLNVSPPP